MSESVSSSARMYYELSEWYPLVTSLSDYKEEADYYHQLLTERVYAPHGTLLELGSGAGHNAFYLKEWYDVTLSDLSEDMLQLSLKINPGLPHHQGDMRDLRLGKTFDIIFIHDAIVYMTSGDDLKKVLATSAIHCRPGGILLISPDHVKETFKPSTDHGGEDGEGKSLRYLEWMTGPNNDGTYTVDYVIAIREGNSEPKIFSERHYEGLFPKQTWLDLITKAGFKAEAIGDPFGRINFLAVKQA